MKRYVPTIILICACACLAVLSFVAALGNVQKKENVGVQNVDDTGYPQYYSFKDTVFRIDAPDENNIHKVTVRR